MSILLDVLILVIVLFCALRGGAKTIYRTVANLLILLAVFAGSVLGTFALRPLVQSIFTQPHYTRLVASDMAQMVSTPELDDPYLTVANIDIPALVDKQGAQFEKLTETYNVTPQTVLDAVSGLSGKEASEAALKAIVTPISRDIAKAITYAFLFLLLIIILRPIGKRIYEKRALNTKITRNTGLSIALGTVAGLLWSYTLIATLVKCFYPYQMGVLALLGLHGGVDGSFLMKYLLLFNPF